MPAILHFVDDDEPDYSDQLLPRASSPSTLENCTLPPEYFRPPPPVEIPLPDKAKIKKMKKKDEEAEEDERRDFAEEEEEDDDVMELDPNNGFIPFKDIKKEEPQDEIIWEDVGDPDDIIEIEEVGPPLGRSRRDSNESVVSSTTGNSSKKESKFTKEEMERRKEYREYKRRLRARKLAKKTDKEKAQASQANNQPQVQSQNNGFGPATASTSANCHPPNYFQSPPKNANASSAAGASGNNFQQQFPSFSQTSDSGFQHPQPPSGSSSGNKPQASPQAQNNNQQQEPAAPNKFSNPNNSIHIDLGSMPLFAADANNDAAKTGSKGESRGARFAIYLGNDKVPALNLVVTPQNGNEPPAAEPQPGPAAPAPAPANTVPAPLPSPTKSNEAVQTESRRKGKYSSHAPVFQTEAELIQIIRYCKRCDKYFGSRREATEHQKRIHDRKFCACCFKLLRFSGNEWKDHMKGKHQDDSRERAKCPFCGNLHSFEGMYLHISRAHLKLVEDAEEDGEPPLLTPHPPSQREKGRRKEKETPTPREREPRERETRRKRRRSSGRREKETATTTTTGTPRITPEERLKRQEERLREEREAAANEPVAGPSPICQEKNRKAAAAAAAKVKLPRPPPRTVPESVAERRLRSDSAEPPAAKNKKLDNLRQEPAAQARGASPNTSYRNFQMVRQDYVKTPDKNDANPPHSGINQRVNAFLNNVFQQSPHPPDREKYSTLSAETGMDIENLKIWFEHRYKEHCRAKNRK